jgi:NAD+ kinase
MRRPIRSPCCAMPSPDHLRVRRVALMSRRAAADARERVEQLVAEAGVEVLPDSEVAQADLVIVLGGDGSVLRALQLVTGRGVPVFGVNFGRVGFLTTAEPDELEAAVTRALAGELRVVDLATVQVEREGKRAGMAVNDVVVASDVQGRIARLGWNVDGVDLGELACDAVIVCTPAGSTGYGLSAGGPVLDWGVEALGVTFVAPHTLTARPLVLPRGARVEVANRARELPVRVILDGVQSDRVLAPGESVTVSLAPERTALGLLPEVAFLQRYRDAFTR